jgi:hypothetical protein
MNNVEPNDKQQSASAAGAIQFGDNAHVSGDVFTGGKRVINTGGGAYYAGDISTGGGAFIGRGDFGDSQAPAGPDLAFARLYAALAESGLPELDQQDLRAELADLQAETALGEQANPDHLLRRLRLIGRLHPPLLARVLQVLTEPTYGFAALVVKVAQSQAGTVNGAG